MVEKSPPERKNSGEESIPEEDTPMDKFKSLASRLLSVNKDEVIQRERLHRQSETG